VKYSKKLFAKIISYSFKKLKKMESGRAPFNKKVKYGKSKKIDVVSIKLEKKVKNIKKTNFFDIFLSKFLNKRSKRLAIISFFY